MTDRDRLVFAFLTAEGGASATADLTDPAGAGPALLPIQEGPGAWLLLGAGQQDLLSRLGPQSVVESDEVEPVGLAGRDPVDFASGTGLLFIARAIVSPTIDHDGFNRWYDEVHVPEVTAAGLRRARRFRSADGSRYYTLYDIDSTAVFDSPELMRVKGFAEFSEDVLDYRRIVAGKPATDVRD
jgi:hypothetical protein